MIDESKLTAMIELKRLEYQEREHEKENQLKLKELELKREGIFYTIKTERIRGGAQGDSRDPMYQEVNRL